MKMHESFGKYVIMIYGQRPRGQQASLYEH